MFSTANFNLTGMDYGFQHMVVVPPLSSWWVCRFMTYDLIPMLHFNILNINVFEKN